MDKDELLQKAEKYDKLREQYLKHRKKLIALRKNCDRDNPIDMDIVRTTKAMFYEIVRKEMLGE